MYAAHSWCAAQQRLQESKMKFLQLLLLLFTATLSNHVFAQGEGPRVYLQAPIDINVVSITYMDMSSDINFAGDIIIPGADIESEIYALNYNRFFSIGGHFAEIWATGIFGSVDGSVLPPGGGTEISGGVSGIADPYFAIRVGLIGAPALEPTEFVKHSPEFQLYVLAGMTAPLGDYENTEPLNLGTNRWTFRLGMPMVVPFGNATFLEIVPSLYLYGENDDIFGGGTRDQAPLLVVESHLTHNFTPKFWAGVDLRAQSGGETETNGVDDDNGFTQLGGGVAMGYQFNRSMSAWLSYDEIFAGGDGANGKMLRLRLIAVF